MGDNRSDVVAPAGHDPHHILHILREVAAGADERLLGVCHMEDVYRALSCLYRHDYHAAPDFTEFHEPIQQIRCPGGVDADGARPPRGRLPHPQ